MRRSRLVPALLAAALMAACAAPPAATGPRPAGSKAPGAPGPRPAAGASAAPGGTSAAPGGIAPVAPAGSPIAFTPLPPSPPAIAVPGLAAGNLTGKVKAPASLVSNNGGNLIGNNGGAIVSNNGGALISDKGAGWRLLAAVDQVPAAGYVVELLDGAGRPIVDAAGEAVAGTTDAEGRFALQAPPQANNWLLRVRLADGKGQLDAIVPAANDGKEVPVDLVSTLTTRYILDAYVSTQADAQATLDKLPATIEAETRTKAEIALTAKGEVPAALTPAAVREAVDALRREDPTLDAQLEAVKRLLIPAGQRDLGAGQIATNVILAPITGLVPDGAGGLYLASEADARVWRLGPDGRLATVAGRGKSASTILSGKEADGGQLASLEANLAGVPGTEAALFPVERISLAASGDLLIMEEAKTEFAFIGGKLISVNTRRVTRLGTDGKLAPVYTGKDVGAALFGDGDEVLLLKQPRTGDAARLVALGAAGAERVLGAFPAGAPSNGLVENPIGRDARGRLHALEDFGTGVTGFWTGDPAAGTSIHEAIALAEMETSWALDPAGNRVRLDVAANALEIVRPDGARATIAPNLPAATAGLRPTAVAVTTDGLWLALDRPKGTRSARVYRVREGRPAELVAGAEDPTGLLANEAPIQPSFVAPIPGGGFYLTETSLHRVWKVGADQRLQPFAGTGSATASGDDGPAVAAGVVRPRRIVLDPAGGVDVVCEGAIRHVAPDGRITTRYAVPSAEVELEDGVRMPDGALLAWQEAPNNVEQRVVLRGAAPAVVETMTGFPDVVGYALGPDGRTYGRASKGKIVRWTAEAGSETVIEDLRINDGVDLAVPSLAFDAAGHLYITTGHAVLSSSTSRIFRLDVETKALTEVAGPDGRIFTGKTVDDGLNTPISPVFDAAGGLLFVDHANRQVKRIPPETLAP